MTYTIYLENTLTNYNGLTNEQLLKLWVENQDQNARIVLAKKNHNLNGDVYMINGMICDKSHHKMQFTNSIAATIEEMAIEQVAYLQEQEEKAKAEAQNVES